MDYLSLTEKQEFIYRAQEYIDSIDYHCCDNCHTSIPLFQLRDVGSSLVCTTCASVCSDCYVWFLKSTLKMTFEKQLVCSKCHIHCNECGQDHNKVSSLRHSKYCRK
jgi:hypothetical protein